MSNKIKYGYGWYDSKSNKSFIIPGAIGLTIKSHPIPARLGSRDFYIVGEKDEIVSYLKKGPLAETAFVAQSLSETGHWKDDNREQIYVSIYRYKTTLDEKTIIARFVAKNFGKIGFCAGSFTIAKAFLEIFSSAMPEIAVISRKVPDFVDIILKDPSIVFNSDILSTINKELVKGNLSTPSDIVKMTTTAKRTIFAFLLENYSDFIHASGIALLWSKHYETFGGKYIDSSEKVIVQLSSTESNKSTIKAVFSMGSYKVQGKNIAENIDNYFKHKPIERFLPLAHFDVDGDIF